jgi:hypothetical protein
MNAAASNQQGEGRCPMPRISEFYGIIIAMYYRDHALEEGATR